MPAERFGKHDRNESFFVSFDGDSRLGSVNVEGSGKLIGETPNDFERESESSPSWNYLGLAISKSRIAMFFLAVSFCISMILVRVVQIQAIDSEKYSQLAEGNRTRTEWIPSERGIIYDRKGKELVRNIPQFDLTVNPLDLPENAQDQRDLILRLSDLAGVDPLEMEERLEASAVGQGQPIIVAENLSHEQAILASIESSVSGAVRLSVGTRRSYVDTGEVMSLSHVIGYLGRVTEEDLKNMPVRSSLTDMIGKVGLEKVYEKQLRGNYGHRLVEVDALGRRKETVSEEHGQPGKSLVLSLDLEAQKAAETFLKETLKANSASRGSVVVMDPKTGGIIAMVSLPAYDANMFARGISSDEYKALIGDENRPMFPRAISASLPSGSTFKMIVAAAALDEGVVDERTTVMSVGGISIGQWRFPDWKAGGHGITEITKAIAESVNTYFYAIGGGWGNITGLGVDRIVEYARKFGLGEVTGIDLTGENGGFVPSKEWKEEVKGERWYVGDTYHLAIGQGDLLVTPLQIASMTAVFANGGDLIRPHLVSALVGDDGERIEFEPETISQDVVSERAVGLVRQGMRRTVTQGSARSLSWLPIEVAAKTGTAQWGQNRRTHAWFTSFAPYENPEIVVTVSVEESGDGSVAAAPVARRFYDWWSDGQLPIEEFLEKKPAWFPVTTVSEDPETAPVDVEQPQPTE